MYCLIDFCCICFYNKERLQPLSGFGSDNITYFVKLTSCVPEMCFNQMNNKRLICNKCCETMDAAYKFRQRCLRSKTTLIDYISQQHQISNISGVANVYLTDLNKFVDIKKEYQKENNIEKTEMFRNINENTIDENVVINSTTEIKRENNPISLKLIDYGNNCNQIGNVIIKMEEKNQNSDEDVEETLESILVNQHDTKIDVSQNDIKLTDSAINRENENQDFEKQLHERLDNNLEIFDSENVDIAAKVEENNYNSLYLEKCFDEIKIEIVDNDIKPINSGINIQCKSENNEEFSTEDNDLSLEDEEKKTSLSKNIKQKKGDVVNRKDEIIKKHECSLCKKNFSQSSSLNNHMRIHTGKKPHACDVCQKKFTQSSTLSQHMRIHTGEKSYECSVCQKKFTYSSHLKEHMRIHTGEKPHECDVCQKKFTQSSALSQHMRIHTGEKPHECDVCQKKFTQSSAVNQHMRIHTGKKPYAYDICQMKFTQSGTLMSYNRIHKGEELHACDVCQKKFTQLGNLTRHKRIHTGEKPYACDICEKKFTRSAHLSQHMRIHSGEKPHECDVCQKKFTRSAHLSQHMLIHTGENPHECDVCQKKFTPLCNLIHHKRVHTGEKPNACDICENKFIRSAHLSQEFT